MMENSITKGMYVYIHESPFCTAEIGRALKIKYTLVK